MWQTRRRQISIRLPVITASLFAIGITIIAAAIGVAISSRVCLCYWIILWVCSNLIRSTRFRKDSFIYIVKSELIAFARWVAASTFRFAIVFRFSFGNVAQCFCHEDTNVCGVSVCAVVFVCIQRKYQLRALRFNKKWYAAYELLRFSFASSSASGFFCVFVVWLISQIIGANESEWKKTGEEI